MQDVTKSREQILRELEELRRRNIELEHAETERRAALDALQESEMRFRSVSESAVDAIVSADAHDRIVYWNPGAARMFGYSEAEILGKPTTVLIPERLREAHRLGMERFLKTGKRALIGTVAEVQALRKDGTEFAAELSLSTWTSREGRFFSGIIRDVSDRKEAERALEQRTEEAKARTAELESLIQMVAHDLKSPVIAIVGLVRSLKTTLAKGPIEARTEGILQQLTGSGTSMESFLRDLLDGLASEQGIQERASVSLDTIVRACVEQHRVALEEKAVTVHVESSPDIPPVSADERRIRQVIDNILGNAIRYMGEKPDPIIRVHVEEQDGFVLTRISDNGVGIPEQYRERIFDRFFRGPHEEDSRGTGLGLAIAKQIVQRHGGSIWVESEEGHGAAFAFTLPVCAAGDDAR